MSKFYWLDGTSFIKLLNFHRYSWQSGYAVGSGESVIERTMENNCAYVITANHSQKTIGIYPLEIYVPGSPTQNDEKYNKIVNMCGSIEDLENDILLAKKRS